MRYLPNGNWMQKADQYTINEHKIPSLILMEHAALKTIETIEVFQMRKDRILIVCGSGNNGGDGFAIARLFFQKGCDVDVVFIGKEQSMSEECHMQKEMVRNLGIHIFTEIPNQEYTIIIDAIFGVGLSREITGHYATVIQQMNQMKGKKVAVDISSGISSFQGTILGIAFRADLTVSFQCEKIGTVLFPGKEYAGNVVTVDIGIGTKIFQDNPEIPYTLEREDLWNLLPKRQANSHKGMYGKVLMIVGGKGMAGAAYLSARAAYTCGAGLVQIYTPMENRAVLQELLPESIITTYETYEEETLEACMKWADVICIGCGIGKSETAKRILETVLIKSKIPCVIDADGLNLLSKQMELLKQREIPVVLTPHMREMSRLTQLDMETLSVKRFEIIEQFVKQAPVICALKDARTLVSCEGKQTFINTAGNQAMAKAGSGDVLAGVITGLLAQHLEIYEATVCGVYLHACGGDEARIECGSYGMMARDLIRGIQAVLKKVEEQNT